MARFVAMSSAEAHTKCKLKPASDMHFSDCPQCHQRVGLHCDDCRIQITGCLCTEVDRFGNDDAWKRAVDRFGEEVAKEKMRNAGLWVPPEVK